MAYNNMLDKTNSAIQTVLNSTRLLNQSSNQVNEAFNEVVASSQEVSVAINEIAQELRSNQRIQKKQIIG